MFGCILYRCILRAIVLPVVAIDQWQRKWLSSLELNFSDALIALQRQAVTHPYLTPMPSLPTDIA